MQLALGPITATDFTVEADRGSTGALAAEADAEVVVEAEDFGSFLSSVIDSRAACNARSWCDLLFTALKGIRRYGCTSRWTKDKRAQNT